MAFATDAGRDAHAQICPNVLQFYDAFWQVGISAPRLRPRPRPCSQRAPPWLSAGGEQAPFVHLAIEYMDAGSLDVQLAACQLVQLGT